MTTPYTRSLDDILCDAYAVAHNLQSGSATQLVAEAIDAGFDRAILLDRHAAFAAVEARCVVARTKRAFLDLVLA